MKRIIPFFILVLLSVASMAQNGTDVFFSEYIEGNGNNKALEIFNPGDNDLDLSPYRLVYSVNGGQWDMNWRNFPTNSNIPPKKTWTLANSQFTALGFSLENADELDIPLFSGNDAIGLMRISAVDTVLVDVIGIPGVDPGSGWDVAGVISATANHTLIRKSNIERGNSNWEASRGTNETDSEWIVKPTDFADSLGQHFFRPTILITGIKLSNTAQDSIKTDRGTLQILAEILPLTATDKKLLWSSSQNLVASVDQNGLVLAFNDGSCWIRAFAVDGSGMADSVMITTLNQSGTLPVNSILVDGLAGQDTIFLNLGSLQMTVAIKPENANNKIIEWGVDNTDIAGITQDGILSAKRNGKVLVTAKSTDGSEISGSALVVIIGQFSEVGNISALRQAYRADGTVFKITSESVLTHQVFNRNTKYVQDEGAGIEIDDPFGKIATVFKEGDGITGLTGSLEENYGMLQFHPTEDPGPATSSNLVHNPLELSVTEFNSNFEKYESRLIRINHLQFDQAGEVFLELMNYTTRIGNDIAVLRTEFANADFLGTMIPDSANVTGIAVQLNATSKIAPRSLADISRLPHPLSTVSAGVLHIQIYPNPADEVLFIDCASEVISLSIFSSDGKLLIRKGKCGSSSSIDIKALSKGIYFVNIEIQGSQKQMRFIKK